MRVSAPRSHRVVSLQRMSSFPARWLYLEHGQEERIASGDVLTDQAWIRRAWIVAASGDSCLLESLHPAPSAPARSGLATGVGVVVPFQ